METSALNGNNIDKLLENIAISIYEKDINDENNLDNTIKGGRITLYKEDFTKIGKKEGGEGQGEKKKKRAVKTFVKIIFKIITFFILVN